jgi:hypothetical protein
LYGKKFIANRTESRIQDRKESRDAIVYDIDVTNKFCLVRVAGTDILVRAWFPANFMRAPVWLKTGTAVRIAHVGGDKSRIEVVSPGLVQPTSVMSPMMGGVDAIMVGMDPTATGTSWQVKITAGTYRINGVLFTFAPGGPGMDNENWHMGDGGDMSGTYWWGVVDPISPHDEGELWYRYDAFMIGTDGVVDYVKGEEWQWTGLYGSEEGPTKPAVPVDHVLIRDYILVSSYTTSIDQANIGEVFIGPYPNSLSVEYGYATPFYEPNVDGEGNSLYARNVPGNGIGVVWGGEDIYVSASEGGPNRGAVSLDMEASATITVLDQYGQPFSWWASGSLNELDICYIGSPRGDHGTTSTGLGGPGEVPPLTDNSGIGSPVRVNLGLGSSYTIHYVRAHTIIDQPDNMADGYPSYAQGDADSHTAVLKVDLISEQAIHPVSTMVTFVNLNAAGSPM